MDALPATAYRAQENIVNESRQRSIDISGGLPYAHNIIEAGGHDDEKVSDMLRDGTGPCYPQRFRE
jgi:hypothetical protein